ncbi:DUF6303 family protein [Streptomyces tsukubensis]|uniref:DUF6303 family protein n=1 Tax=Streptomyces tsukubensis TaxID=83656 RepID=UPI00368D0E41
MPRAQMAMQAGRWRVYVAQLGLVSEWPGYDWPAGRSMPVPSVAERRRVLAGLGFETVPGGRWEWCEDSTDPDDDRTAVILIAAVDVRPAAGDAS